MYTALSYKKAVSHSLVKGGGQMGNGRWVRALRFLVYLIIALMLMVYISPKAY